MKICKICKKKKSIKEYYIANKYKNIIYSSMCKSCNKITAKKRQKYNSERKYLTEIKFRYGVNKQEYYDLYKRYNGKCYICLKENIRNKRKIRLSIDHCHKTGKIRGLLCVNCNAGVGYFNNNPILFKRAMEYLQCQR